ncbi:hypothetical protein LPB86_14545 [Pedobacter sp. MC2016-14]|uniref:hypothetical protein n=1 Tax=Pedobacter sp. MC2016-14 TaxID=2897327 RepID=UPI001E4B577D|nr:hypothetical protein [Pedobacter sp. MC2016-14]MCD0489459.1 hypothetical protein [Pedobacter sp. MC2016-14]
MKKLIYALVNIPVSILTQQFPEAPMCFYMLKNAISSWLATAGYKTLLAMDLKTHACEFRTKQPIVVTKVGYRAWRAGIVYSISFWEPNCEFSLSTCIVEPKDIKNIQFFSLQEPICLSPEKTYYISRTYLSGGPNDDITDYVGWLSNNVGSAICPFIEGVIQLSRGFFSDDINPFNSECTANISTSSLLPLLDFEYRLL